MVLTGDYMGKSCFGINAMHEVLSGGGHKFLGVIMGNREDTKMLRVF